MDEINDKTDVVCCFCGTKMDVNDATIIVVYPTIKSDEGQQFFCHKEHFVEKLDKSVIFYLDDIK